MQHGVEFLDQGVNRCESGRYCTSNGRHLNCGARGELISGARFKGVSA
jgi:hypothetical protein